MAARGCFWLRCVMTYAVFSFTSTRGKRLRCGLPWKPYLVCERVWLTRAANVLSTEYSPSRMCSSCVYTKQVTCDPRMTR